MVNREQIGRFIRSTAFVGILIQLCLVASFLSISAQWGALHRLFLDPKFTTEILMLVPGCLARFNIGIIFGGILLSACFLLESKTRKSLGKVDILIAVIVSVSIYFLIATRTLQFPYCSDDSFIDFRYVFKWVNGLGFDYNTGEKLMGFSSILHLVALTVLAFVFDKGDVPVVSQMFNCALHVVTVLLLFVTMRKVYKNELMAALSVVIFSFSSLNIAQSIIGKEAPLVTLLLLLSIFAWVKERPNMLTWSSALLALTRPEGIIWHFGTLALDLVKHVRKRVIAWLIPTGTIAVTYAALILYFGVNNLFHGAKGRAAMFSYIANSADRSAYYMIKTAGTDIFGQIGAFLFAPDLEPTSWILQGLIVYMLLFELGRTNDWLRPYAYNVIAILTFFCCFDPWMFSWYYGWFSLLGPFMIPILARALIKPIASLRSYPSIAFMSLLAVLCMFNSTFAEIPPSNLFSTLINGSVPSVWPVFKEIRNRLFAWNPGQDRLVLYRKAAIYIAGRNENHGRIATWEPGVVGYFSPREHIVDLGGLVSDEALKFYPVPVGQRTKVKVWGSIPPDSVNELKPEWVLFFDCFADCGLLSDERFLSTYRMEKFWVGPIWDSRGLYIFKRIKEEK